MSNSNLPGNIAHKPGVLCFVAVSPVRAIWDGKNNGKTVVIVNEVFRGSKYSCQCGSTGWIPEGTGKGEPIWKVSGSLFCQDTPVTERAFFQSELIPIGSEDSFKRIFESEVAPKDVSKIKEWISQVESTNS